MPNTFAYAMLLLWPLIVAILFRRLSPERAFIWTILGGYLVLPPIVNFDLPLTPAFDKHSIPTICAFVALWLHRGSMPQLLPQSKAVMVVLSVFMLGSVATVLTNGDAQVVGGVSFQALPASEAIVSLISQFLVILPFLLAQDVLRRPEHMREIVLALMIGGLFYSLPMLIEIRLSPQLNVWIYGFFQHNFDQMMRYGGFRPIVFLQHGLWVAFFAFMAVGAALTALKYETPRLRPRYFAIALYLAVVLVLCKTAGALIYLVCFAPMALFLSRRMQIRIAAAIALVVILYPMLRGAGFIPTDAIIGQAGAMDEERSRSLVFRLMNEDMLLSRAAERPAFGWGGWGRNHVHDPISGEVLTVVDGLWIGLIGSQGWFGYIGLFGLLTLPLFFLAGRFRSATSVIDPYAATLALLLAFNLVDLIPNATLIPFTWLIAGALLGYLRLPADGGAELEPTPAAPSTQAKPAPWARQSFPNRKI